jgi:methylated-DNA-[protein]-cysteine S-methyltransferase|tara:strand:+ start:1055 stop:1513 length:459 start_codon:yes stop_codon:yes gene_type:complete
MINILSFKSNYGWISCEEKDYKITSIFFGKKNIKGSSKSLNRLKKEIINYLSGKSKKIKFSYLMSGSRLQIKIWKELQKIPYGKTKTYGQIAKKLKTSPRYVGNVCGQNSFLLAIPCHRVIRSDGKLGGFSGLGGIKLKKRLLNLELKIKNL